MTDVKDPRVDAYVDVLPEWQRAGGWRKLKGSG